MLRSDIREVRRRSQRRQASRRARRQAVVSRVQEAESRVGIRLDNRQKKLVGGIEDIIEFEKDPKKFMRKKLKQLIAEHPEEIANICVVRKFIKNNSPKMGKATKQLVRVGIEQAKKGSSTSQRAKGAVIEAKRRVSKSTGLKLNQIAKIEKQIKKVLRESSKKLPDSKCKADRADKRLVARLAKLQGRIDKLEDVVAESKICKASTLLTNIQVDAVILLVKFVNIPAIEQIMSIITLLGLSETGPVDLLIVAAKEVKDFFDDGQITVKLLEEFKKEVSSLCK